MNEMRQDMVLFAEDWDSGASAWSAHRQEACANDLGAAASLVADGCPEHTMPYEPGP